jgi:hypothetical protein
VRTLARILYDGRRPQAVTVDKILAVQVDAEPALRTVPAVGTVRRLRALRAIGWTNNVLAPRLGVDEDCVSRIAFGHRDTVRRSTAAKAEALYRELSEHPAPVTPHTSATRTRARMQSWFPPIAWDAELLDDPDALPCLLPAVEPVDRVLELHVQHLVAGHPVKPTAEAVREVMRRMPDAKAAEIARVAQTTAARVSNLRASVRRAAA